VAKRDVPLWVRRLGGLAVVKSPYANAGLGVWTITHDAELRDFMAAHHRYDRFIVQVIPIPIPIFLSISSFENHAFMHVSDLDRGCCNRRPLACLLACFAALL
jgi:hypothetical protein